MEKYYNINGFKQGQVVKINDNRNSRYSFLCNEKYIGRELTIDYFMYIFSEYYVCFKEIPNNKFYYFHDLFENANNDKKELVHKKKNCFRVKCLDDYYDIMTKGKIYEFIDGQFRRDNGDLSLPYSSFSDFVRRNPNYEVELIEETSNLLEQKEKLEKELVYYKEITEQQNKEIEKLKSIHDEQLNLLEEKRKEICELEGTIEKLQDINMNMTKKINNDSYEFDRYKKHIKKLYKHIDKLSPERMDL